VESFEVTAGPFTFRGVAAGPADGRLVLFLHGFPQSSHEWRFQLAALASAGYRAVAFDQRGYSPGARPAEVAAYAVGHLVADVLAVADDMGGHCFDLVGHDWGAAIAWQVAGRYPERVRTLTAVSVPHPHALTAAMRDAASDQGGRSSYMARYRSAAPGEVEAEFLAEDAAALRAMVPDEEYVRRLKEPGALAAAINWYRAATRDDVAGVGPATAPTLFVWSDGDHAIGRDAAERCGAHVDGPFRFEVIEGVDHWIPEHAPDRLNALLLEHLAAHP
jgi:pimeloyl-ACP methyl ester carboxylesterase